MFDTIRCPKCGSHDIRKIGHIVSLIGKKQRYQCNKGHTFFAPKDYFDERGGNRRGRKHR